MNVPHPESSTPEMAHPRSRLKVKKRVSGNDASRIAEGIVPVTVLEAASTPEMGQAESLSAFLARAGGLTPDDRQRIVEQALIIMEQNYVHLPLKKAMHAVDPVQRLRLLLHRLEQTPPDRLPEETEFHREMTEIFTSVRDLHTNYFLPAPFAQRVAFLPFMIADYIEDCARKYLVARVASDFSHPTFEPGVELLHWNGAPMRRAIASNAQRFAGSNMDARHARGVAAMTTRPLLRELPPDEEWVVVGYRSLAGKIEEVRFDWMVATPPEIPTGGPAEAKDESVFAATCGIDAELDMLHRARAALFRPRVVRAAESAQRRVKATEGGSDALPTTMPAVLRARPIDTVHGTFGYVGIRTFAISDADRFMKEFVRLIEALPQNGLVLDVRGNGGGNILAGEQLLQVLTPHRVEPATFQFVNSSLNLRLCRRHGATSTLANLSAWKPSIEQSIETGAVFSNAFPISSPQACNTIGQRYHGPVILVTDALCYSTTDIFAAGFQDHKIGDILGVDGNTGAGGANVWKHEFLPEAFAGPDPDPASPYKPMPNGSALRVALRRTLRVGPNAGVPVEDIGVIPDQPHSITRDDILRDNRDLFAAAAALLVTKPVYELKAAAVPAAGNTVQIQVATKNLDRLDAFVNRRPQHSIDLQSSTANLIITKPSATACRLHLEAYAQGKLKANRILTI